MTQLQPYRGGYFLWKYVPSVSAAIVFLLLFLAATVLHFWRMYKTRSWFCICFTLGCLFEFIGYSARAAAHNKTGKMMPFVIQNVYILVAPALFAASIYMTLGRIIRSVKAEHLSLVRTSRLTKTFVIGDLLAFFVQGSAAGFMFIQKLAKVGKGVVVAGLVVQILMFGLFVATAIVFHIRLLRHRTSESYDSVAWKQSLYTIYGVSCLISIRSTFRVIEYLMGQDGYLLGHEWTLYLFDSLPMLLVTILFYLRYPNSVQSTIPQAGEEVHLSVQRKV